MRHMPQQLREVSAVRTVGFMDAVRDLGTHKINGMDFNYSANQVRLVLQGKSQSLKLIRRIVEKRPDLLMLRFVPESVRSLAEVVRGQIAQEVANG